MNTILRFLTVCLMITLPLQAAAQEEGKASAPGDYDGKEVHIKVLQTSDLHGCYFPYDFMLQQPIWSGLSRIASYINKQRKIHGDNMILLDNGDFLEGQPSSYYYDFIDTVSTHVGIAALNFLKYDAGNIGNHDLEMGMSVLTRCVNDCQFPVLGANIVRTIDDTPAYRPYIIKEIEGVRVAVLGMVTPAIPMWLPENMWEGLRFDDMEATARRWIPILLEEEKADVVIGLFHAGHNAYWLGKYRENASVEVVTRVPGFDLALLGHDHTIYEEYDLKENGDSILVLDPSSRGLYLSDVDIYVTKKNGKVVSKRIEGGLSRVDKYPISKRYSAEFLPQYKSVKDFISKRVGVMGKEITTRDAFFGPSDFVDFVHTLQLQATGAEISLNAPLSFDVTVKQGEMFMNDIFKLYKYGNTLYTMRLTGREIKGALEYTYGLWTNQMKSPNDHLFLLSPPRVINDSYRSGFLNPPYNFDSAAGIYYTVDVTKPKGEKIKIKRLANGKKFALDAEYVVVVNSHRGNGGGEILTKGAGITKDELKKRILSVSDFDFRYYLLKTIEEAGEIYPQKLNQWKFIPEKWVAAAAERDYKYLFEADKYKDNDEHS